MDDLLLLETIERYFEGKMSAEEKAFFEQQRKNIPEVDQMVVEHSMFLHQMDIYSEQRNLKHTLHETHARLLERGEINEGGELSAKGKVIRLYNRYRKVTAIAAVVGGAIALVISGLTAYFSPTASNVKVEELRRKVESLEKNQQYQGHKLNEVESKIPKGAIVTGGGSGFMIDGKGYIITNAHVLKGSAFATVVNSHGQEFTAKIVSRDERTDLAILKIDDGDFKPMKEVPYSIRKTNVDLGEEIFTLGYPRNDLTFNLGYLSAKTGYNGDTVSCQIQMNANPGNSGGPVLNKNGEVIGVLSSRQIQADGVGFAIKSKNIYQMIDELKKTDTSIAKVKMSSSTTMKGLDRKDQIKKMESCVFLVKAYNR